jgi:hypothetical protein
MSHNPAVSCNALLDFFVSTVGYLMVSGRCGIPVKVMLLGRLAYCAASALCANADRRQTAAAI